MDDDLLEYKEYIRELKGTKWNTQKSQCRELLKATRPNRMAWIVGTEPTVSEILEEYPIFKKKRW